MAQTGESGGNRIYLKLKAKHPGMTDESLALWVDVSTAIIEEMTENGEADLSTGKDSVSGPLTGKGKLS